MSTDKKNSKASQCDLDKSTSPDDPRPLATVLGDDSIRDTVAPFIGYTDTAVSVHERSGARVGGLYTGNSYCDRIARALASPGAETSGAVPETSLCDPDRSRIARAAIASGSPEEQKCFADMTLRAVPIVAERQVVGAVVGAVSEIPSDKKTVLQVAEATGIDFESLWQAASTAFHKPDYIHQAARSHLERLADTLGRFYEHSLERERAVDEILHRDSEVSQANQFLNRLLDSMAESVLTTDNDGNITYANAAASRTSGYAVGELKSMHALALVAPEDAEKVKQMMQRRIEGKVDEYEITAIRKDGSRLNILQNVAPLYSGDEVVGRITVITDVSERHRMGKELKNRNRQLTLLQSFTAKGIAGMTSGDIMDNLARGVAATLGYEYCSIFLISPDGKRLNLVARNKLLGEDLAALNQSGLHDLENSGFLKTPVAQTYMTGKQIVIENISSFQGYDRMQEVAKILGSCSMAATPLVYQEEQLGALVIHTREIHSFTQDELQFLQAVADQVSSIAANVRLYQNLERSEERYRELYDSAVDWMYSLNESGVILNCNGAMAAALGFSKGELIGRHIYEFETKEDSRRAQVEIKKAWARGIFVAERTFVSQKGQRINVDLHARLVTDEEGTRGWEVIGRDITEQEQLRQELTQSEKLRALGEMAGGVAHDFNNFLTVIMGNTQLLLADQNHDGDTIESLEAVQRAAADAAETVRRIQEFTRVRTVRSFTTVDVNQAIANAIEVARPRWRDEAEARGVRIHMDVELKDTPPVNGNATELGEVFMNLLLNAADALPDGGTITVRTGITAAGMVEVTIADNGDGMPDEVCQHIFEPFYSTKGPKGSGLGLSLAFGIVNRHGGDIAARSQHGKGSTFQVLLPIAAVSDLQDDASPVDGSLAFSIVEEAKAPAEADKDLVGPLGHGRVLVIEDEGMIRTLLADILEQMGQDVATASGGKEGVSLFQEALAGPDDGDNGNPDADFDDLHPFDLVLTDLGMPEMSGWEVVERIKDLSPETPVALITGWGDQLDPERQKASGVDVVMAKPFSVTDVKKLIAEALAGKK